MAGAESSFATSEDAIRKPPRTCQLSSHSIGPGAIALHGFWTGSFSVSSSTGATHEQPIPPRREVEGKSPASCATTDVIANSIATLKGGSPAGEANPPWTVLSHRRIPVDGMLLTRLGWCHTTSGMRACRCSASFPAARSTAQRARRKAPLELLSSTVIAGVAAGALLATTLAMRLRCSSPWWPWAVAAGLRSLYQTNRELIVQRQEWGSSTLP